MKGYCKIKTTNYYRKCIQNLKPSEHKFFIGKDFEGIKKIQKFSLISSDLLLDDELLDVYFKTLKAIKPLIDKMKSLENNKIDS